MPNPQFSSLVSYFHNIFGLRVQNANFGIYLHGWANANTISNIQGYRLGNTTLGVNTNAFIYCHGALDNAISNCFFHQSANSIGLLVDSLDNTGGGGNLHEPFANSFSGMVFEQGGASALGVKSLISTGNSFYEIRHNTSGGNSLPADFTEYNVFIGLTNVAARTVTGSVSGTFGALTSETNVSGATVESSGEVKVLGSVRTGDSSHYYVAKKVKRNAATNAATVSFTLSNAVQAAIWRFGYVRITVAGGDNGAGSSPVAWFLYRARTLGAAFPSVDTLKDSGGDTASFTVTDAGNGVVTISSTQDAIVCELEYGFTTTNVNVT
jgi:hypothetical protein